MDTGERTLLLECDLETHSDEVLGVPGGPGLGEWLDGDDPSGIIRMPPSSNAFVIRPAASDLRRASLLQAQSGRHDRELQSEFPTHQSTCRGFGVCYSPLAARSPEILS